MNVFCNPLNIPYKYQFHKTHDGTVRASREAADPSMIEFKGRYYIFPSMTCGFLYSDDLAAWHFHPLKSTPGYDYAPDVRVVGEFIYFCASSHDRVDFYRTLDPFADRFEKIEGGLAAWDPNLFEDEGRLYFYWGSSTTEPIFGVELDRETLQPIGQPQALIHCRDDELGYERSGENHIPERSPEEIRAMLKALDDGSQMVPDSMKEAARSYISGRPYMEGVWMTRHEDRYYLQYASPSSGFNVYSDGVYVSNSPLGPFELAKNNPFSYKPGGFIQGAGHGSTLVDRSGNCWHTSTMRICINHNFERRIGLWPAGWDSDGELYCNQRYGDWPVDVDTLRQDPWTNPPWMLLSYGKPASASSSSDGHEPERATDENVRTWWKAKTPTAGEWLTVDLAKSCQISAVQINFADDSQSLSLPDGVSFTGTLHQERWIDEKPQPTRWKLEGSVDGQNYFQIEDKSQADTDLPHDLVCLGEARTARYIRLTAVSLPYGQVPCVSGLRVFGSCPGSLPDKAADVKIELISDLDMAVRWTGSATGYVVVWGYAEDKLYHSCQVCGDQVRIGGLVKGQSLYVRVDAFNETGITEGEIINVIQ